MAVDAKPQAGAGVPCSGASRRSTEGNRLMKKEVKKQKSFIQSQHPKPKKNPKAALLDQKKPNQGLLNQEKSKMKSK